LSQDLSVEALHRVVSPAVNSTVLADHGRPTPRVRKLTAEVTSRVLSAMNLYPQLALGHVLRTVAQGLRFIWPDAR
jgi:hypothetical protein